MTPKAHFSVLLFDPDPQGRQKFQDVFSQNAPGIRLLLRARTHSFTQALNSQHVDAVVLGLPMEHTLLCEALFSLATFQAKRPLLFLVGEAAPFEFGDDPHPYTKDHDGISALARLLPILVRAARIDSIILEPGADEPHGPSTNRRTSLAERAIDCLAGLGLASMYISIDPLNGRWMIRASTYSEEVIRLIASIEAKGGQVAPHVEQVSADFRGLLRGQDSLNQVGLKEFLQGIMPWGPDKDLKQLQRALGLESIFLAPVVYRDHMHGILAIGKALHEIEQQAVHRFTARLASWLTQASAMDELQERAKGLLALQGVLVSVTSTLDTTQLMDQVLDLLTEVVTFDGARVYAIEDDQIELTAARGSLRGRRKKTWQKTDISNSGSLFLQTLKSGNACLQSEVMDHSELGEPGAHADWRSWIAVPIQWQGEIRGMLTLSNKLPGSFQPLHLEITETVAQQLGVALENARLLESAHQRAEKLKIVHEIGRSSVSLLDSQLLVFEAAQRVMQIFNYDQVGIFMVAENTLIPEIYLYGKQMQERKGIRNIVLNSGSIFDEAVRLNLPIVISHLEDPSGLAFIPGTRKARAAMLIPLSIKAAVVGVMLVLSHKKDGVDQDDVEILQVLAAQLGISLVNARLFSEVRAHAAKLEQRVSERTDELQSQKDRTEAILRSVADAVMVLNLEGRLVLANPTAQTLLSGPWSDQLYQRVVELHQDETKEQTAWEFGPESFEALASSVEQEGQSIGTVIVLRNITRMKELDRLKDHFVATVSHELRTPLANIKLYLSLLRRTQGERENHYFQTLGSETDRLTTMIEDLLDLSRLDAERQIEFQFIALKDLLEEIVETQGPICSNKRIELIHESNGNPIVFGNHDRLIQVFTNLMANAIAYTPAGNAVGIRLLPGDNGQAKAGVVIEVEDAGMGIPADELPYVFDRFYRGRMAQQLKIHGSGLGLAIVREIVESHGGTITVRSDIGQGTCFRLWLPITEGGERIHG
ncbi:MAG: GAF domain-containing protein [Anaerolineales bacterium]|nr:MAG: GAF domain-containing protein [Anaerolineales bacterium]